MSQEGNRMSSESQPISPAAFAEAIQELPLSALHAKASEIRNSIAHLHRSNSEMRTFADLCDTESDRVELEGYIRENEGVITSMQERIQLLKAEVEGRGQEWIEVGENNPAGNTERAADESGQTGAAPATNGEAAHRDMPNGTENGEGEEGVFL